MISKTGIAAHDDAVILAEAVRQNAIAAAGATAASIKAAEITYYRSLRASAVSNNLPEGVAVFSHALWTLGTGGV
jgi:hypothetical protein